MDSRSATTDGSVLNTKMKNFVILVVLFGLSGLMFKATNRNPSDLAMLIAQYIYPLAFGFGTYFLFSGPLRIRLLLTATVLLLSILIFVVVIPDYAPGSEKGELVTFYIFLILYYLVITACGVSLAWGSHRLATFYKTRKRSSTR